MKSKAAILEQPIDGADIAKERIATTMSIDVNEPKAGEVLVEISAAGVCHTDVTIA